MQITRERFIGQFFPAFIVRVLGAWKLQQKNCHEIIRFRLYEAITGSNGKVPIPKAQFYEIVTPMVLELIATTPKGTKPDSKQFAGLTYDVLDAAGVEVEIGPPIQPHGHAYGRKNL